MKIFIFIFNGGGSWVGGGGGVIMFNVISN